MEFKHADRNDNIQMKRFFLNGFHQAHSSRQIAALCMCVYLYDDKLHSEDSKVYISNYSYSENVASEPEV